MLIPLSSHMLNDRLGHLSLYKTAYRKYVITSKLSKPASPSGIGVQSALGDYQTFIQIRLQIPIDEIGFLCKLYNHSTLETSMTLFYEQIRAWVFTSGRSRMRSYSSFSGCGASLIETCVWYFAPDFRWFIRRCEDSIRCQ